MTAKPTNSVTKSFAYLRVSSTGQIDGNGFERQQKAISAFASSQDMEIQAIYKDSITGTTADRPQFEEMVTDILSNGVRTVIVEDLSRLAREYRVQEHLIIYLASKGISLFAANTGEDITEAMQSDPMKKALIQIQGIFAELDKSLLVKRLRKAREAAREATGRCEGRKQTYDKDSEVVKRIRQLRRKRGSRKQMSLAKVAAQLNQEGFTNADGGSFKATTVHMILKRV